jgi:calcium-dependent protein kinase
VIELSYDQRCDIWSAGVILYILATATPPFDGADDGEILKNAQTLNYSLESKSLWYEVPEATKLSASLKDLIRKILVPESKRITIDEILSHPWMTNKLPVHSL